MNVSLPTELAQFVEEQVRLGRWDSPEQVVEAGLARLMLDPPLQEDEALDEETAAAIEEADAQIDRGEGLEVDEAFTLVRAKCFPPKAP